MKDANITKSNTFPNKVEVNLHMFSALMLDRILGHVNGADIVTIHKSRLAQRSMKLSEELPQPSSFSNGIGNCSIFSLSTGVGNGVLALGRPRDEIVPNKDRITGG
jgi:hypothetical protein